MPYKIKNQDTYHNALSKISQKKKNSLWTHSYVEFYKGKKTQKKKKKGKKPEQVVLFLVVTRGRDRGVKWKWWKSTNFFSYKIN